MKFFEVLDIINGRNQKQVENPNGKYPIYGSGGVMGYADDYICGANTVIIGRKGSINNPIYVDEPFWNVDTAFGLVAHKEVLLPKFLYYFCVNFNFEQLNTTVTIPSLTKANLLQIEIAVPSIEKQGEIVAVLDKVSELIDFRYRQLKEIDNLVKSRFIEMFGERYTNDKKWENKPLYECADFYNGKAHEQVVDGNGEYILVTSRCIASDITDYRRTNALLFPLKTNDIVMVMSDVPNGRALAKCLLIDEDNKYTLNQRICCLRNYAFNPIFFYHLLNRHEYFLSFDDGNAQTNLRKDDLLACNVILPPIELQNQFATFVEQIDKSKFEIQKSLEKLEILKKSLMQQYFG